ncbi:MAG: hypothetical protein MUO26_12720 [Methanotrichaceae archaeon]|nr:hypothetical protein [Methanotrichaceae archaeon]
MRIIYILIRLLLVCFLTILLSGNFAAGCPPGQIGCVGQCVDPNIDVQNCGYCGHICLNGKVCSLGDCTCPAGTKLCGDNCIALTACCNDQQLAAKDAQIAAKDTQIADLNQQLAAKDAQIADFNQQLAAKDTQIADLNQQLAAKDTQIADLNQQLAAKDAQIVAGDTQIAAKEYPDSRS